MKKPVEDIDRPSFYRIDKVFLTAVLDKCGLAKIDI